MLLCKFRFYHIVDVYLTVLLFIQIFRATSDAKKFPENFLFGVATSAYQIEGGWNSDDKGVSVWDDFVHSHPSLQNADVGANSYEYFLDDIKAIKNMNVRNITLNNIVE